MSEEIDIMDCIEGKIDHMTISDVPSPIDVRILSVRKSNPADPDDGRPVDIFLEGRKLPFRPCLTMRRLLAAMWGSSKNGAYEGRTMRLYVDQDVTFGGQKVGGIRISHASDLPDGKPVKTFLSLGRKRKGAIVVQPLSENKSEDKPADKPAPAASWKLQDFDLRYDGDAGTIEAKKALFRIVKDLLTDTQAGDFPIDDMETIWTKNLQIIKTMPKKGFESLSQEYAKIAGSSEDDDDNPFAI